MMATMKPRAQPQIREIEYTRPWMYERQADAFFHGQRIGLVEASTKSGKTFGGLVWLAERAMLRGRRGRNYWWVAPVHRQAMIAYRRLKRSIPRPLFGANDTEQKLTFVNGAVLWFLGSEKPDNLYAEDVYAAVIDEASRVREQSWHAIRTTVTATRGPMRIIGNVKGKKNWFYRMCRRAEGGDEGLAYSRIVAADAVAAGILDAAEIELARADLPESVFRELYLAEASDDEGNPFGIDMIRDCMAPLSDAPAVAFGVDLAKSVDWTVNIGLDANGSVCHFSRFQAPWPETTDRIRRECGEIKTVVDSTGVGDPILDALQKMGGQFQGFQFTAPSKQKLMEGLAVAIQGKQISYPDGPIVVELEQFEYEYTRTGVRYSAPDGLHDDCVCALALAWRGMTQPRIQWRPL